MKLMETNYEKICTDQAQIISELAAFAKDILWELKQHTDVDAEERRLKDILGNEEN